MKIQLGTCRLGISCRRMLRQQLHSNGRVFREPFILHNSLCKRWVIFSFFFFYSRIFSSYRRYVCVSHIYLFSERIVLIINSARNLEKQKKKKKKKRAQRVVETTEHTHTHTETESTTTTATSTAKKKKKNDNFNVVASAMRNILLWLFVRSFWWLLERGPLHSHSRSFTSSKFIEMRGTVGMLLLLLLFLILVGISLNAKCRMFNSMSPSSSTSKCHYRIVNDALHVIHSASTVHAFFVWRLVD